MKEVDSTLQKTDDKAIEKTYPSMQLNLKSFNGAQEIYVTGEDNSKDIVNTYLIMVDKIDNNRKYLH